MRLPASEKLEIIGLVEQSHLPARRTLQMLGIKPSTFYRWYDRFRSGGLEALEDKPSKPDRGTVRNSVCEAIMMEGKGASYGYRERPAGPTFSWA
jgi:transposase-like protein